MKATYSLRKDSKYLRSDYDGGVHPDVAIELIEKGFQLIPTDKNYKIYLESEEGRLKAYFHDWEDTHKNRLIELVNEKKVNFSYPGYFYNLPFFCVADKEDKNV